ncbi:Hypothetical protein FKW44_023809, partial [Caligus rogercresseyi]
KEKTSATEELTSIQILLLFVILHWISRFQVRTDSQWRFAGDWSLLSLILGQTVNLKNSYVFIEVLSESI